MGYRVQYLKFEASQPFKDSDYVYGEELPWIDCDLTQSVPPIRMNILDDLDRKWCLQFISCFGTFYPLAKNPQGHTVPHITPKNDTIP